MKELEMIKAFAELEGVSFIEFCGDLLPTTGARVINSKYNPITNLALNCAARDKYEVRVDYFCGDLYVVVDDDGNESEAVMIRSKAEIPRAVIECILKANNLWIEK